MFPFGVAGFVIERQQRAPVRTYNAIQTAPSLRMESVSVR